MKKSELRKIIREELKRVLMRESLNRNQMIDQISSDYFGSNLKIKELQAIVRVMTGKQPKSNDEYDLLSDIGEVPVDGLKTAQLQKIMKIANIS